MTMPALDFGRYASSPWSIPWAGWWRVTKRTVQLFADTDMSVRCAGARLNAELELQTKRDSTTGFERPMGDRGAYVADHVR